MPRPTSPAPPVRWTVQSVAGRARDGPQRLDQAYRLLLATPPPAVPPPGAEAGTRWPSDPPVHHADDPEGKEPRDARRDLCSCLDRPPGT